MTAAKSIKVWNLKRKELLHIFTGHSTDITILTHIELAQNSDVYLITGSKVTIHFVIKFVYNNGVCSELELRKEKGFLNVIHKNNI